MDSVYNFTENASGGELRREIRAAENSSRIRDHYGVPAAWATCRTNLLVEISERLIEDEYRWPGNSANGQKPDPPESLFRFSTRSFLSVISHALKEFGRFCNDT